MVVFRGFKWAVDGLAVIVCCACASSPVGGGTDGAATDEGPASTVGSETGSPAPATGDTTSPGGTDEGSSSGAVGESGGSEESGSTGGNVDACAAVDVHAKVAACDDNAPGGSLTPTLEWERVEETGSFGSSPLVINLTDDNGDGAIDLCDTPDVVVMICDSDEPDVMVVLDGATGEEHWRIPARCTVNPSAGDLDGDGDPEIFAYGEFHRAMIVSASGEIEDQSFAGHDFSGILAYHSSIADLDNDGDAEIVNGFLTFDHNLNVTVGHEANGGLSHTIVDLDGDDDMEIIYYGEAYHHDGSLYWTVEDPPTQWLLEESIVTSSIVNVDADDDPEIAFGTRDGIWIREHDGTHKAMIPFEAIADSAYVLPVPTWANVDSDPAPELVLASSIGAVAHNADGTQSWSWASVPAADQSRIVAFDLLGQGRSQVLATNEAGWALVDEGSMVAGAAVPGYSFAIRRGPVIADIDNDGSAEVLVADWGNGGALRAYGAEDGSWARARRIWNQYDYHVTNVAEDGSIPTVEPKSWLTLETYGAQAQINAAAELCIP